jgi:hypothetical protein
MNENRNSHSYNFFFGIVSLLKLHSLYNILKYLGNVIFIEL